MKKFLAVIALSIALCMFSGCFILDSLLQGKTPDDSTSQSGNSSQGGNTGNAKYIFFADNNQYEFELYNKIKITPSYKTGYVLNGYYTDKNGGGALMLDYMGNAINAGNWSKGFPYQLYPYYEEIDYNYVYNSTIGWNETHKAYNYNFYNDPTTTAWEIPKTANSEYIHKIAVSNPDIKLKLTGFVEIKDEPTIVSIGVGNKSTGELDKQTYTRSESFMTARVDADIKGATITNNSIIWIGVFCTNFGHNGIAKNARLRISIEK